MVVNVELWWVFLIIVIVCLICSAFCSAADLVYAVVDQDKLAKEASVGNKHAKRALKIAQDYELSISTILLGNNIVNIIGSSFVSLLAICWNTVSPNWNGQTAILTIAFTLILIVFAEFFPKAIAKRFNYKFSKIFVYPVLILKYSPTIIIVWPIAKIFKLITKPLQKRSKKEDLIDEEVLNEMVDEMEENKELEEAEAEALRGAISLNETQAFEIMTPRVDVFAINIDDDIEKILKEGEIFAHSRIPIYKDTVDNIVGILPLKSLLRARLNKSSFSIIDLCYKPLFIPRNQQVLELLKQFKNSKIHIAVVIDEYGGTEGIVTMEDILEEVVGDIFDEADDIEESYVELKNGDYIIDGQMNIDDFFDLIDFHEDFETDYSTVGGLCQEFLKRFAKKDDEFVFMNLYKIKVLEADEFTAEKLLITKLKEQNKDE